MDASKGGKARAAKMTSEERSAAARKAVQARWAKTQLTYTTETVSTVPTFTLTWWRM